jgi:hypothetical protein
MRGPVDDRTDVVIHPENLLDDHHVPLGFAGRIRP